MDDIVKQIADLTAAGRLAEFPKLAALAAERAKAAQVIAEIQADRDRAAAEQADHDRVHVLTFALEPSAADDVAIVRIDRGPAWQFPITAPDGRRVLPRVAASSLSFAPAWMSGPLGALPVYMTEGWFTCTPAQAIDLFSLLSSRSAAERMDIFRQIVSGITSVSMLLAMSRRLSVPGVHIDVVAAARVVRSAAARLGHDPASAWGLRSHIAERAAEQAEADRIWSLVIGSESLPALPIDPQTAVEQKANATLLESQRISQARLAGVAQ